MDSKKQLLEEYEGIIEEVNDEGIIYHFVNIESLMGRTHLVKPDHFGIQDLKEGDKIRCREYERGVWEFERNSNPDITDEYWAEVRKNYQEQNNQ